MYESTAILKGKPVSTYDQYGNESFSYTDVVVYVRSRSVYASEYYNAAQVGLHPTIVLELTNREDYHGEKLVKYEGVLYDVVRADWSNGRDRLSLTLAERIGNEDEDDVNA